MSNELLSIIGALITFLLMGTTHYFRKVHLDLQDIKVAMATIVTEKSFMLTMIEENRLLSKTNAEFLADLKFRIKAIERQRLDISKAQFNQDKR